MFRSSRLSGVTIIIGALGLLANYARADFNINFATSDGGLTPSLVSGTDNGGGWAYGNAAPSVGGLPTWFLPGQNGVSAFGLTTPSLLVASAGQVTGTFTHRFSFEGTETPFDSGQIQFSVNGGAFNTIPANLISATSYGTTLVSNAHGNVMGNQFAFEFESTGYSVPSYVTSNFILGTGAAPFSTGSASTFVAGDHIEFRFLAAYDPLVFGPNPDWQIASLNITNATSVPEPSTFVLAALSFGGLGFAVRRKKLHRG